MTLSYSYSSQNVSLILLHRELHLIMRCVLTEPGKKQNSALNWIDVQPIRAMQ